MKIAFGFRSSYLMTYDTAVDLCGVAPASSMSKAAAATEKDREIAARIRAAGTRARSEAEQRRAAGKPSPATGEIGGRDGPEPTRYGDWECKGVISDF